MNKNLIDELTKEREEEIESVSEQEEFDYKVGQLIE